MADIYDFSGKKQEKTEERATPQEVIDAVMEGNPHKVIIITESEDGALGLAFNDLSIAEVNMYLDIVKNEILHN